MDFLLLQSNFSPKTEASRMMIRYLSHLSSLRATLEFSQFDTSDREIEREREGEKENPTNNQLGL